MHVAPTLQVVTLIAVPDLPLLFAKLITKSVKELDTLIDRLPNDDQTAETDVRLKIWCP